MRRFIRALLILLLLSGITAALAAKVVQDFVAQPVLESASESTFLIQRGESWRTIVRRLGEQGLVQQPQWLYWYGRFTGKSTSIKAGEYQLSPSMVPDALLALLASGKSVQHAVTIVEGWTFAEALASLQNHDVLRSTLADKSPEEVAQMLELEGHPEGWLLPETYFFTRGASDMDIVRRAHVAMQKTLDEVWAGRQDALPLQSAYEALTLASIIEKETARADERARIGGVFVRRLRKGMLLQTDPTVIYGMGERYQGNIRRSDLRRDTTKLD